MSIVARAMLTPTEPPNDHLALVSSRYGGTSELPPVYDEFAATVVRRNSSIVDQRTGSPAPARRYTTVACAARFGSSTPSAPA